MFKVTIREIDKNEEEEIVVRCHEIDDEVLTIVNKLKKNETVLLGNKNNEVFRIAVKDIFYVESVDNKTFIYVTDNVYESKLKLYEIEQLLSSTKLFRCSKSMILNISKIRSVAPSVNGRFEAKLMNNETVIISRQYVPNLKKCLGMWGVNMKNLIKLVVTHFFIITVCVLFVTSISNLFSGNAPYSPEYPWTILLTGLVGAVPSFLFYFKNEPTKKQFATRFVIHFFLIEILIMTEGYMLGWYESIVEAIVISSMIIFVYLIVCLYTFIVSKNTADSINKALENLHNENND